MKRYILLYVPCFWFSIGAFAQDISQTVKGKVRDKVTDAPLSGVNVTLSGGAGTFHIQTDESGQFSMTIPVGRYSISSTITGYIRYSDELLVTAGHEGIISISMEQSVTTLQEVSVEGSPLPDEIPGIRSLSIEKTLRFPANFFDPLRVVTAYPGVMATNDQNNSIIVRGNSPNGLLWRMNGVDIVNPNHLANAGTLSDKPTANGGGVNILSAQMLDRTDFYVGAFPASYGNALSGVIDMKLREGNTGNFEYTAQASLIGMDVAAEGPLGKDHKSAFLVNYRYSTVGLLSELGIDFGGEAITFQDFSFHVTTPLDKRGGNLSLFGFWGNSRNDFRAREPGDWQEDKDMYDIRYTSDAYAVGFRYSTPVKAGNVSVALAFSGTEQDRRAGISLSAPPAERFLLNDQYDFSRSLISSNLRYQVRVSKKISGEAGVMVNYQDQQIHSEKVLGCLSCSAVDYEIGAAGSGSGVLVQPYTRWNMDFSPQLTAEAGLRYLNDQYSGGYALEPRLGLQLRTSAVSGFNLAYGLVSQVQSPHVYYVEGNEDLGFTRAHHVDLGYRHRLSDDMEIRTGLFYQGIFDVPVEDDPNSTFSALNLVEGFAPANLVNRGKGENYGVDVTLEKLFFGKHYFLVGGSCYESKYIAGDGVKRDTPFNGNYTANAVYGKEWNHASKNRSIGLSTRLLYLGGLRVSDVDVEASQAAPETVYNDADPFGYKQKDYFRIDVRLSFRKDKPGYTRTFAIDIQNLSGRQNEAYRYYDRIQQRVVTKYQLGLIPVLVYRIDF